MQIEVPEGIHHLVTHQWHRSIEDLHVRHDVLDVRSGMPLDPQLRPLRLQQQVGPPPAGLLEDVKELQLGRRNCRPERGRGSFSLALAIIGYSGAVWCCNSARAIATLRRSCRRNCLRRRCRLRAAAVALASRTDANMKSRIESNAKQRSHTGRNLCCCCCC